jgi:hypothetical protein
MRARNLKPGLFKNEILGAADPLFTTIFQGLWCLADREGRLEDRPSRIHIEINPYRPGASTVRALDWLQANTFLVRYEISGVKYIAVRNFSLHQQPHVKEPPSKIPAPPNQGDVAAPVKPGASPEVAALIPDSGFLIPKAKAAPKKSPRSSRVPEDFSPDIALAIKSIPDIDAPREIQKFRDWEFKKPRSDWPATWRTWIQTCRESGRYAKRLNPNLPPEFEGVEWQ